MPKNHYCQSTYKLIIYKIGAPNILQSCWEWNSFVASLISFLLYLDVSVVGILHHPELQVPMIAVGVGLLFFHLQKYLSIRWIITLAYGLRRSHY